MEVLQLASEASQAEARVRRTGERVLGIFAGQLGSQRGDSGGKGGSSADLTRFLVDCGFPCACLYFLKHSFYPFVLCVIV